MPSSDSRTGMLDRLVIPHQHTSEDKIISPSVANSEQRHNAPFLFATVLTHPQVNFNLRSVLVPIVRLERTQKLFSLSYWNFRYCFCYSLLGWTTNLMSFGTDAEFWHAYPLVLILHVSMSHCRNLYDIYAVHTIRGT